MVITPTSSGEPLTSTASTAWNGSDPNSGNDAVTVSVAVIVPDAPPVAEPDSYAVDEDSTLTVPAAGVLANDADPNGDPLAAVLINGPASGTLVLDSNGGFSYTPNANFNGQDSFTYKAGDASGAESSPASVTLTINAVNDAPVNSVPGPQATAKYLPLFLSVVGGNPISISDVDAGTNAVRVALSATNGRLTLSRTTGLTFTSGDGTADVAMTFAGTISNVNAALNGMRFVPPFGFSGSASLTIATDDQGQSGAGGAVVDTDVLPITVGSGADLVVTMADAPDPVAIGSNLTYSIGVTNNGPVQATTVTVIDVLPYGVEFVSATANQGACVFMPFLRTVRCDLGSLAIQGGATAMIVVRPTSGGTLTNVAVAGANQSDPVTSNNFGIARTEIQ
jgi:uncharacterized repeat protein (TIGR01451 family)